MVILGRESDHLHSIEENLDAGNSSTQTVTLLGITLDSKLDSY